MPGRPWLIALLLVAAACERVAEELPRPPDPISVYAAYAEAHGLGPQFERYTEETGVRITVKTGDPGLVVDAVINNNGAPPADILLTGEVAHIWRAAEEGGLRPLSSESVIAAVPSRLRDPDDLWVGLRFRKAAIAFDPRVLEPSDVAEYRALADSRLRGELCLSSSSLSVNRALIAMLIADAGVRPAEIIVRGWKANLAQPVLDSEPELLEAIAAGNCSAGIVSSHVFDVYASANPGQPLKLAAPVPAHINVEGIGLARHARNPAGAEKLIEWLVSQSRLADAPLDGVHARNVGMAGWYDEDATRLAERAGYP